MSLGIQRHDQQQPAFVGIRRACELAGFSKSTIRRWIRAGRFPAPVIVEGNVVRFDLAEILAWRAAQFRAREERLQRTSEQLAPRMAKGV